MAAIITMSIVLGAELGPKADPTTTTYTPRPEWYFFFLFELLRVIKPPALVPLATIGVPTICMILLFLLPFYDRGPERRPERRPIATTAGIFTIAAMGYLTYLGAARRLADADRHADARSASSRRAPTVVAQFETRQAGRRASRAAWPATRSARTATTARAAADRDRARACPSRRSRARSSTRPRRCRRSRTCSRPPEKFNALVAFLVAARSERRRERADARRPRAAAPSRSRRSGRCSTASRGSTT